MKTLHLQPKRRSYQGIIALCMIGLCGIGLYQAVGSYLTVKKYQVIAPNSCVTTSALESVLKVKGQSIIRLDKQAISQTIQSQFPCAKGVKSSYTFPDILTIVVETRVPFALLASYKSTKLTIDSPEATPSSSSALLDLSAIPSVSKPTYIIDDQGVVFDQTYDENLPIVFLSNQSIQKGLIVPPSHMMVLKEVIPALQSKIDNTLHLPNQKPLQIKVSGDTIIVPTMPIVVLGVSDQIPKQLASLQLILDTAKINQRPIKSIDLRFNKPIVIYEPSKKD